MPDHFAVTATNDDTTVRIYVTPARREADTMVTVDRRIVHIGDERLLPVFAHADWPEVFKRRLARKNRALAD